MRGKKVCPILLGGFFLLFDQFFKWQTLHAWNSPHLLHRFFGWYPFFNSGVAFGLPIPNWITLLITIPIIGVVFYLFGRYYFSPHFVFGRRELALLMIGVGAVSNLVDRIIYQETVDYLLLFTGVINIADVLIVFGFGLLFWRLRPHP